MGNGDQRFRTLPGRLACQGSDAVLRNDIRSKRPRGGDDVARCELRNNIGMKSSCAVLKNGVHSEESPTVLCLQRTGDKVYLAARAAAAWPAYLEKRDVRDHAPFLLKKLFKKGWHFIFRLVYLQSREWGVCLCSSVGRAGDWKSPCRWFDSDRRHHFRGFSSFGRAPPCQGGGGGFEPRNPLQRTGTKFVSYPFFEKKNIRRHSQAVRQRSAKPSSPVRFRVAPPWLTDLFQRQNGVGLSRFWGYFRVFFSKKIRFHPQKF